MGRPALLFVPRMSVSPAGALLFHHFTSLCEQLENEPAHLRKTEIIRAFFASMY